MARIEAWRSGKREIEVTKPERGVRIEIAALGLPGFRSVCGITLSMKEARALANLIRRMTPPLAGEDVSGELADAADAEGSDGR
jgi:hypothetical protein